MAFTLSIWIDDGREIPHGQVGAGMPDYQQVRLITTDNQWDMAAIIDALSARRWEVTETSTTSTNVTDQFGGGAGHSWADAMFGTDRSPSGE